MIRRLTDNYNKYPNSNISKLLQMIEEAIEAVDWNKIRQWRGVNDAEGKTLDLIGDNVNQPRGAVNDVVYRSLIRSKVLRNNSNGTINELIALISFVLQTPPENVELIEGYEITPPDDFPGYVLLKSIPSQELGNIGLTTAQLKHILNEAAAAGVRVEVEFIFNTWGTVTQYTWGEIQPITWQEVKEVELSGVILP